MSDRLKSFGIRFGAALLLRNEEQVFTFVRRYLKGRLQFATPGMFAHAIASNTDLWKELPPAYKNVLYNLSANKSAREVWQKYSERINVDLVLKWLNGYWEVEEKTKAVLGWKTTSTGPYDDAGARAKISELKAQGVEAEAKWVKGDRPDLGSIVINWRGPQGRDWLKRQLDTIKSQFTEAIVNPPQPQKPQPQQPTTQISGTLTEVQDGNSPG
ncbi:MAG: hypothetical protein ACLP9K_04325 [Nitrososphaerales archaeon]